MERDSNLRDRQNPRGPGRRAARHQAEEEVRDPDLGQVGQADGIRHRVRLSEPELIRVPVDDEGREILAG